MPSGTRLISETPSFRRLLLVLLLIWLLLNLPVLLGIRVLPWDAMDEFYPSVYFNVHSLRLGLAPWWNPYIYSGYPQIADPQGMLFSPLLMAWMLLRDAPGPIWFDWGVLLHLLMGSSAMLGMLRRDGANALGALVGATVFMAGGVAASRLEHSTDVVAYAYAPVVLLTLRYFLTAPSVQRGSLLGLAAGALVTQLVQTSYLLVFVIAGYAVAGTIWHWPRYTTSNRWRWCAGISVAIACALVLGLPQLLFSWAYMSLSNRTLVPLAEVNPASLDLRAFLSMLDPNALHALHGTYNGPASTVEAYFYIGALPLLSMLALGRAWRNPQQRQQLLFFIIVGISAVIYMLGTHTPIYAWLYSWLPGVQHFRRPGDAAYLLNLAFAVMAGIAASHIDLSSRRELTALLAVATCWLALASLPMSDHRVRTLMAAAVAAIALWRLRKPGSHWRAVLWLLAVLVVDYRCFNLNGSFNEMRNTAKGFTDNSAVNFLADKLHENGEIMAARIATQNTSTTWDNMVVLRGIPSTQGYNPLRYVLYDHWYGTRESSNATRVATPFNPPSSHTLNDLLGVRYLVIGHRSDMPPFSAPADYVHAYADDDVDIWRNDHAYPIALAPVHVRLVGVNEVPGIAEFSATDFRDTLWLTPRDASDADGDHAVAPRCTSQVQVGAIKATPTQITMDAKTTGAGWIVSSELDFPGWLADLDGKPLPIHRANGIFRAVCVTAGEHRLRFTFHPWSMVAYALQHRHD